MVNKFKEIAGAPSDFPCIHNHSITKVLYTEEVSRLSFHYICAVAINLTLSESSDMNVHQVFFKEPCGKSYKEQLLVYWIMSSPLVTTLVFSTDIRICQNNSINGGRLEKTDSSAIG